MDRQFGAKAERRRTFSVAMSCEQRAASRLATSPHPMAPTLRPALERQTISLRAPTRATRSYAQPMFRAKSIDPKAPHRAFGAPRNLREALQPCGPFDQGDDRKLKIESEGVGSRRGHLREAIGRDPGTTGGAIGVETRVTILPPLSSLCGPWDL